MRVVIEQTFSALRVDVADVGSCSVTARRPRCRSPCRCQDRHGLGRYFVGVEIAFFSADWRPVWHQAGG